MTDSTMVERVAAAIRDKRAEDEPCGLYHQDRGACFCDDERFYGDSGQRTVCQCKLLARAAIEAMMEPEYDAIAAGQEVVNLDETPGHFLFLSYEEIKEIYQTVLRSSLKGEGE